ncbi:unnamed protein product [Trichobilharzia regenti]|nr:unnamed protein product [Trichobilharzia regenti]
MSPFTAVYREPVLTRVAASLRSSPSESSESLPTLHIMEQSTINSRINNNDNDNNLKGEHSDTLTLPSSLSSLGVVIEHENNNECDDIVVEERLKENNYISKSTIAPAITEEEEGNSNTTNTSDHINNHENFSFDSGFCPSQLIRHECWFEGI